MRTAFVAYVAFIGATLCVAAMQQSEIAFVDVTVIPMDTERVLDHHTVVGFVCGS
jgi:hypothetical protein